MAAERTERIYLFDFGDSTEGPIGYCARIVARTEREAIARLKALLPEYIEGDRHLLDAIDAKSEYLTVYFGRNVSEIDIDGAECPVCGNEFGDDDPDRCPYEADHGAIA
jgi:hypothetical protein